MRFRSYDGHARRSSYVLEISLALAGWVAKSGSRHRGAEIRTCFEQYDGHDRRPSYTGWDNTRGSRPYRYIESHHFCFTKPCSLLD
eukprot:1440007-Prymnesium_polylepis.2